MARLVFVLSLLPLLAACYDAGITDMNDLDLAQDLCLSEAYDKLENGDVRGKLRLYRFPHEKVSGAGEAAFLAEIEKLIAKHNEEATVSGREYIIMPHSPVRMPAAYSYRELGHASICPSGNRKACRNRNFWMFKKIAPQLSAQIIFENTVGAHSALRSCCEFPRLVRCE